MHYILLALNVKKIIEVSNIPDKVDTLPCKSFRMRNSDFSGGSLTPLEIFNFDVRN